MTNTFESGPALQPGQNWALLAAEGAAQLTSPGTVPGGQGPFGYDLKVTEAEIKDRIESEVEMMAT